jgi:hypothetical protein
VLYRRILSAPNNLNAELSQTISGLNVDQTYAFSFYYRITNVIQASTRTPSTLKVTLGDEVIFMLAITSYSQASVPYVLATKAGIRPQSSTAVLAVTWNNNNYIPGQALLSQILIDNVSLVQEEPSTTVVCSPAAPT